MNINRHLNDLGLIIMCLCCAAIFTGCQKNSNLKQVERFINKQINCETFKEANGDAVLLKETFLEFFEEEAYEKYLDDVFGYMYPQLFYITNADEVKIQSIKCKETIKQSYGESTYQYEVKYTIIPVRQKDKKIANISMKDTLKITVNRENKLTEVIILSTSDTIKKLLLDVKVQ